MLDEQIAVIDLYAGHGLRLDEAVRLAKAAESAGFGGLWTLEAHTEPFLPLVLAAEHTSRIELGTASGPRWARTSPGGSGRRSTIPPSG
jgi:alkanesulfonate monooxygenase SsuD/methylene tetrahydromethanopterin reductase-like flavin-dependent oxidoreductase (luciferase family)